MTFDTDYQSGQIAFERGEYRQAVSCLLAAVAQVQPNTRVGGEVQVWLATAYEATGQISEAKALCQKLSNHPNLDTRQASKRMLYIMQAPELTRRDEWLIKIPDLTHLEDAEGNSAVNNTPILPSKPKERSIDEIYAPVDLSQVNTKDNGFISIALIFTIVTLIGLWLAARV
ncbi:tetratricopeptide repeat protein [Chamaesiphon sp. VAR_48_metabat_135_sub]|uniref:tetratricopeptide repeat protein n=1 Tax=Chamaesiphon sp. VAR_48_metabat_135_sub TaxID=2964699 RepID=UPI00286D0A2B|nr:tetratricopeptide repeat protein [Chamaesiphon sp. VAR_48_metabat_135_sub]